MVYFDTTSVRHIAAQISRLFTRRTLRFTRELNCKPAISCSEAAAYDVSGLDWMRVHFNLREAALVESRTGG